MVREVLTQAWAQSPARVLAAVALTPVVVYLGWVGLVLVLVAAGR